MRIPLTFVTVSVSYSSFCCASLHHLAVVLSIPSLFSVVQPCHTVTRGSNDMYTPMALHCTIGRGGDHMFEI